LEWDGTTRRPEQIWRALMPSRPLRPLFSLATAFPCEMLRNSIRRMLDPSSTPSAKIRCGTVCGPFHSVLSMKVQFLHQFRIQRFESCRPSRRVLSLRVNKRMSLKTARYRGISQMWLCLRVRNLAMKAPFLPLLSPRASFGASFFSTQPSTGFPGAFSNRCWAARRSTSPARKMVVRRRSSAPTWRTATSESGAVETNPEL
jgi:hypothetical protein